MPGRSQGSKDPRVHYITDEKRHSPGGMPRRANTTTSPERALLAVDEVAEPERVVENRPLDYGLKAVHLTEMANRVWKRASEYRLIIVERRCLTAGDQPPPKATAGQT